MTLAGQAEGSVSREVADTAQRAWEAEHPNGRVTHREVGLTPLLADAWSAAQAKAVGLVITPPRGYAGSSPMFSGCRST
jgi:FMN-dependent NADH-azoreductase